MSTPLTPIKNDLPTVLLFGRANVGKSTLFNKLIGRSQALVADVAGTTRDPNRAIAEWQGVQFNLIDAGGIVDENVLAGKAKRKTRQRDADDIDTQIQTLAREAIKTADVIVFVADTKTGLQQQDTTMARFVRRLVAPQQAIIAAANKADTAATRAQAAEFFALGFGEPSAVSAASGSGTGDLLDRIVAALPSQSAHPNAESPEEPHPIRVVVLGKPNVGKSSLLNALTGKKTAIVSAVAHTTREPQDVTMRWGAYTITFTDTAGLVRAQSSAYDDELVRGGMSKTVAALKRADIALLLLDITQAASHFEAKLASDIIESGINAIIVGNKWDLVEHKDAKAHTGIIYRHLPFLTWAPILFLSAKNRTKLKPLLETIVASHRARTAQLDPAALGEFLTSAVRHAAPLSDRKQRGIMKHKLPRPHLKELEQVATDPPRFVLHAKAKMGIKGHYITYLENRLRDKFKLVGTPVQVTVEEE